MLKEARSELRILESGNLQANPQNFLIDTVMRLARARENGGVWQEIVTLAQEAGAEFVSVGQFPTNDYWPNWARTSVGSDLAEEFVAHGYQDVDPILLARNRNQITHHSHVKMPHLLDRTQAKARETACIRFDMSCGVTDMLNFRISTPMGQGERMITLSGGASSGRSLRSFGNLGLAAFADLLAINAPPPTPEDPDGKCWDLYAFLSARERDCLCYLSSGLTNDQIAFRLGIAEVTVRMHFRNARQKMGAATREQALALALDRGLISL